MAVVSGEYVMTVGEMRELIKDMHDDAFIYVIPDKNRLRNGEYNSLLKEGSESTENQLVFELV